MAAKKSEMPTVKVGQVWRDRDPRQFGRWLVVQKVAKGFATCRVHRRDGSMVVDTGRDTRVSIVRFRPTSTGYELVERIGVRAETGG